MKAFLRHIIRSADESRGQMAVIVITIAVVTVPIPTPTNLFLEVLLNRSLILLFASFSVLSDRAATPIKKAPSPPNIRGSGQEELGYKEHLY